MGQAIAVKNNLIMAKVIEYKGENVFIISEINDKIIIRYKGKIIFINRSEITDKKEPIIDIDNNITNEEDMKITKYEDTIKSILQSNEKSRNSDFRLYCILLMRLGFDPKNISAFDLLKGMQEKTYPNLESVGRARRKLQESNVELRGSSYESRKEHEKSVRTELGYIETPYNANGMIP